MSIDETLFVNSLEDYRLTHLRIMERRNKPKLYSRDPLYDMFYKMVDKLLSRNWGKIRYGG